MLGFDGDLSQQSHTLGSFAWKLNCKLTNPAQLSCLSVKLPEEAADTSEFCSDAVVTFPGLGEHANLFHLNPL